jgi:transcription factor SPN1
MSASPEPKPDTVADPHVEADQSEEPAQAPTPGAGDEDEGQRETPAVAAESQSPAANDDEQPAEGNEYEEKGDGESDDESILSEVDEAQFEDFDPENVDIEDRPQLAIDEDNLKLIGRHKRKRTGDEADGERSQRKREGRREKKSRRMRELEDAGSDDEGRSRKKDRKKRREATPEDEELLDPETRM